MHPKPEDSAQPGGPPDSRKSSGGRLPRGQLPRGQFGGEQHQPMKCVSYTVVLQTIIVASKLLLV